MKGRTPRITMDVARACFTPKRWRNHPLHGNMRGTRYRWLSGLTIVTKRLVIPSRAARCKPMNADAVLYDVRRIRRAKRSALALMIKEGFRRCAGCHRWTDPTICHCGDAITHNSFAWGHQPVPMGCDCMRAMESQMGAVKYTGYDVLFEPLPGPVLQEATFSYDEALALNGIRDPSYEKVRVVCHAPIEGGTCQLAYGHKGPCYPSIVAALDARLNALGKRND